MEFTRRDVLKSLTAGVISGSVLKIIPAEAAEYAHHAIKTEKAAAAGVYKPKYFSARQYKTLQALCAAIIPPDARSGGALEAGAPEFIDLITSESDDYQLKLGGGLMWLDSTCIDRFGHTYLDCAPGERRQMLDAIAFQKNANADRGLSQGIEFFSLLRMMTVDAYFTSEIGIRDLGYVGNTFVKDFNGCPPIPES